MPRQFVYECTKCGTVPDPDPMTAKSLLTARIVVFKTIGGYGQTVRSRVTGWLCKSCLEEDSDWQSPEKQLLKKVAADAKV